MEQQVISAVVHDRKAYEKIGHLLAREGVLSDQYALVAAEVDAYYTNDPQATSVDTEWLGNRLSRKYEKHADLFRRIVNQLQAVSSANIVDEFIELRKQRIAEELSTALLMNSGNIKELMEEYAAADSLDDEGSDEPEFYEGAPVRELAEIFNPDNMVQLHPPALQEAVGGLPIPAHLVIFARPEMGKSLFGINMAATFAHQGDRTLYFGNEDPARIMLLRFVSRFTGLTRAQILSDMDNATELAMQRGYGNLRFVPLAPGSISDIRKHILAYDPKIVVVDQLTNLTCGDKSKTDKFEELAYRMRMLLRETGTAGISLCQAGESAEGKLILSMDDVYYSNTGIAAQCDVMVGMGANGEFVNMNKRMLSLCKNKLGGSHDALPVSIDPLRNRITDA